MAANRYYQWGFGDALTYLQGGRDPTYRTIPDIRSTSVQRLDYNVIALRYHSTDVVSWCRDGTITLRTGGWQTPTTKARINDYSPHSVDQDKGMWYIRPHGVPFDDNAPRVLFFDGIEIKGGVIQNPRPVDDDRRREECKRIVDRMVSRYIRDYIGHIITLGGVEMPRGDCIPCSFPGMGGDHILSHMHEGYMVPTLLLNAIKARNYGGGVAFIVSTINADVRRHLDGRADGELYLARGSLRAYLRGHKIKMVEALIQEGRG